VATRVTTANCAPPASKPGVPGRRCLAAASRDVRRHIVERELGDQVGQPPGGSRDRGGLFAVARVIRSATLDLFGIACLYT